jgi:hypothetical protein
MESNWEWDSLSTWAKRTAAGKVPNRERPRPRSRLLPENVGFQFISLRQSIRREISLLAFQRAKIPNKHGPSRANLCTAAPRRRSKIRSLRPPFSKPLDFADLVRIS